MEKKSKNKGVLFFSFWFVIFILALFLVSSLVIQNYLPFFSKYLSNQWGVLFFISALILEVVFAPVSAIPMIPVASHLWGWFYAGVFTLTGWSIGSLIAFIISRRYGLSVLEKSTTLKKIHSMERIIPRKHIFLGVVLLRIAIPVDLVSYCLGIFTKMGWKSYLSASMIGFLPLSFLLAYMGDTDFMIQIILIATGLVMILGIVSLIYKDKKVRTKLVEEWNKEFE